jgi:YVTN family beta-propeller protein
MPAIFGRTLAIATVAFSVFATANAQSVKGTINLSGAPEDVAVNYLTNRVYVAIPSFGGPTDTLAVIDGRTDTVIKQISIPTVAYQVAVDVVRDRVYVGGCFQDNNDNNVCEVAVVDAVFNKLLGVIPVTKTAGNGIQGLTVNSLTGKLFISNASDNVIDVVKFGSTKVNSVINLDGESPATLAVNPFNCKLYVALASDMVDVIDTISDQIVASPIVGQTNQTIAVNWTTGNVFVTNNVFGISTVGVLNAAGTVLANVTAGNTPFGVDVDLFTNLAFVTNTTDNTISVIDGSTNTVKATLPVSGTYVAVNALTGKVYVSGQTNLITVLSEK